MIIVLHSDWIYLARSNVHVWPLQCRFLQLLAKICSNELLHFLFPIHDRVIRELQRTPQVLRFPPWHPHKEHFLSLVSDRLNLIFAHSFLFDSLSSLAFVSVAVWPCIVVGSIDIAMSILNLLRACSCVDTEAKAAKK